MTTQTGLPTERAGEGDSYSEYCVKAVFLSSCTPTKATSLSLCVCLCVSVSERSPAAPLPSGTSASSRQTEAATTVTEVRSFSLQNKS